MSKVSWVIGGGASPSYLGLIEKARSLSRVRGERLAAVLVQPELSAGDVRALAGTGAQMIFHLPLDCGDINSEAAAVHTLAAQANTEAPGFILFESTGFFCAVAPALAARLGCGITADCTALTLDESGALLQIRPAFGGKKLAHNINTVDPTIATVRKGVFHSLPRTADGCIPVKTLNIEAHEPHWKLGRIFSDELGGAELSDADIIVSGGLGLGSRENYLRLYELAENIGASVGASRAAVAAGFAGYEHQVGQTGVSVRPTIYLAFGISGAVQHLSGIMDAKKIVAVNSDPKAAIHECSDLSVIADCREVLDRLIKATGKE